MKIKVIIKRPGEKPYSTWISNSLEKLQRTVGGYIETFTISNPKMVLICNEEGRIQNLSYNCKVGPSSFVGTIIFAGAGINGELFTDIPINFQEFKGLYPQMFKEVEK